MLALAVSACGGAPDAEDTTGESNQALKIFDPTDPGDPGDTLDPTPPPPPPPSNAYADALARYSNFDFDLDGNVDVSLAPAQILVTEPAPPTYAPKGMVVVLIDPRVLDGSPAYPSPLVRLWLDTYRNDLRNEGYDPRFVRATVRRTSNQPDGVTVLGMRRFLRDLRAAYPLAGAILVGDFPEAAIVRRVLVRGQIRETTPVMVGNNFYTNADVVDLASERVAARTDLILADLDGNWESVYRKVLSVNDVRMVPTNVTQSDASWPLSNSTYSGPATVTMRTYDDVFYVRDENASATTWAGMGAISVGNVNEMGPELTAADRSSVNPIARPEISVTRINARHVAKRPTNAAGLSALDAYGVPRTIAAGGQPLKWNEDRDTELRVLLDYIARNHAFRLGNDNAQPFRTAAVRGFNGAGLTSPSDFNSLLRRAHGSLGNLSPVAVDFTKLDGYVNWLKTAAIMRGIAAHSDATVSQFGDVDVNALAVQTGTPWFWHFDSVRDTLTPSFQGVGNGQIEVYRTLWENKKLSGQRFYFHEGCEVNSPHNGATVNFVSPDYAVNQNAESQLFFTNGLAMYARAKVFYDGIPARAMDAIATRGFIGAALPAYFAVDAADSAFALSTAPSGMARRDRTLARKRTYTWSVLGDFTLRVRY